MEVGEIQSRINEVTEIGKALNSRDRWSIKTVINRRLTQLNVELEKAKKGELSVIKTDD